jgi:multiple antibiotic resistance protein
VHSSTLAFATLAFSSLLAIVNPLSAIPLYLAATTGLGDRQRAATLRLAVVVAIVILLVFGVLGTYILSFFGITTEAFRIAGGFIFFGIGSDMLRARRPREKETRSELEEAEQKQDVAIIPLALPALAGPGAITTIITLTARAENTWQLGTIYLAVFAVMAVSWGVLAVAPRIAARMGQTGLNVITRIMGLIAMVIGVQFVIEGVRTVAIEILRAG